MTIRLSGSSSGYVELSAPSVAGSNRLVMPTGNGSAQQSLTTDGTGTLNWQWNSGSSFYRLNSDLTGIDAGITTAGSFVAGRRYEIVSVGTTNFTLIGASSNTVGVQFVATGAGTGTGTANTMQSIFGLGVSLPFNTAYFVQGCYHLQRSGSVTTTHDISIAFGAIGGSSIVSTWLFGVNYNLGNAPPSTDSAPESFVTDRATSSDINATVATTVTSPRRILNFQGNLVTGNGGLIIPQFCVSAANGGAYLTKAGSWINFTPIGPGGFDTAQGFWS